MDANIVLEAVKLKLSSYAPLRPEAWHQISVRLKLMVIKVNESFYRESGSIAYVVKGLLKEYDSRARRKPAIVNLIADNSFIITTENNQSRSHIYFDAQIYASTYRHGNLICCLASTASEL